MKSRQELHYRPIGRGFFIYPFAPGEPTGRSLTTAYVDQYNRKYIEIRGTLEPLKDSHSFLSAD